MSLLSKASATYFYVASKGDHNDFSCDIPEDAIACGNDQFVRLTVTQHCMTNTIDQIQSGNVITIGATAYSLASGSYRFVELADTFNALGSPIVATFKPPANRFVFTNVTASAVTVTFSSDVSPVFGFAGAVKSISVPANGAALSVTPCQPRAVNDLLLKLTNLLPGPPLNYSNLETNDFTRSRIFGVIPMRAAPGCLNVFKNNIEAFSVDIYDPDPQVIGFQLCTTDGNLLQNCPPWSAVIKVEILNRAGKDAVAERLDSLIKYARFGFLRKGLKDAALSDAEAFATENS